MGSSPYHKETSPHDSPMGHLPGTHGAFWFREVASGWAHLKPVRADLPAHKQRAMRIWIPAKDWDMPQPDVEVSRLSQLHRGRVGLAVWSRPWQGGLDHWLLIGWAVGQPTPSPAAQAHWVRASEPKPWDIVPIGELDLVASFQKGRLRFLNMQITRDDRERMDALYGRPLIDRLLQPRRVPWAVRIVAPHTYQLWVGL